MHGISHSNVHFVVRYNNYSQSYAHASVFYHYTCNAKADCTRRAITLCTGFCGLSSTLLLERIINLIHKHLYLITLYVRQKEGTNPKYEDLVKKNSGRTYYVCSTRASCSGYKNMAAEKPCTTRL